MRIFYAFLIILTATLLWMLPVTAAIYDFRTEVQEDTFSSTTGGAETTDDVVLSHLLYDDDTQTIDILSSSDNDTPVVSAYIAGTRTLTVAGLLADSTRTLTVSYDIDALVGSDALDVLTDRVPWIWLICIAVFPAAALVSMLKGWA